MKRGMAMVSITQGGQQILKDVAIGTSLHDLLRGYDLGFPCNGNHSCGKCKLYVSGAVSAPTGAELAFLSDAEVAQGLRLACFTSVLGDCALLLPTEKKQVIAVYNRPIPVAKPQDGCVCAIDIGTTTVVCALYDGQSGDLLAQEMSPNPQRSHGADVISRIEACKAQGTSTLQVLILNQIDAMIEKVKISSGQNHPTRLVITGNSTMLHIFEGLSPESLGVSPFTPLSLFGCASTVRPAYLPLCVGAYVGGDVICAVLASGMTTETGISILVDIGTNGEMAIWKDGQLLCCSTAAGPAFEGAGLSCGSPAVEGAIYDVTVENGALSLKTIGDTVPKSLCGSGIIALISLFISQGMIDETGRFTQEEKPHIGQYIEDEQLCFCLHGTSVSVSQKDIRQIQLAKSAICGGILTLLSESGTSFDQVEHFYIAGGFGSHMRIDQAAHMGLIPKELAHKAVVLGNGALGGAAMLALGAQDLRCTMTELSLSESAAFMDYYVDCMMFEG